MLSLLLLASLKPATQSLQHIETPSISLQTSSEMSSHSIGDQIRSGLKGIKGTGDAIRGTAMEELDKAVDPKSSSKTGSSKNQAIADKGVSEVKAADANLGHHHGISSGVANTGADTTPAAPAANTAPATSSGAHSVAPGNIGSTGATVGNTAGGAQEQPGVNQRF